MDWKSVGKKVKDEIWKEIQDNLLNVPEEYRAVCMRSCNTLWKDHKSKTKINYFEKNKDDPDLVNNPPAHIVMEQWADLVAYWSSEDAKMISRRSSCNRELRGPVHNTSRKHFSQLLYEMQQIGEETDKMSVWKKSRDTLNPEVAEAIADYEERLLMEPEDQRNLKAVKDRVFHSVMGEDGHGYCRTYGSGVPGNFVYP
ncbi:hypothetical protein ACLB2K_007563 [Fragaria x ananassa]